jgi:hypothetical protein
MTGPLVGDATKLRIFAASVDNLLAMFFGTSLRPACPNYQTPIDWASPSSFDWRTS